MPGLTVAEKSHWRERIAVRIARAIERIKARHPALFDRVAREAHARALISLGLADTFAELDAIKAEEAALSRRKKQARRSMLATLRGHADRRDGRRFRRPLRHRAGPAPGGRRGDLPAQAAHQEQMLAEDGIGREIARLEAEKDAPLDMIWLATSPAQIEQLWTKVGELLGDEPTTLERDALAIEPAKGE